MSYLRAHRCYEPEPVLHLECRGSMRERSAVRLPLLCSR
jgi:hypothetical protein